MEVIPPGTSNLPREILKLGLVFNDLVESETTATPMNVYTVFELRIITDSKGSNVDFMSDL